MPKLQLSKEHSFLYDGTGRAWPLTPGHLTNLDHNTHLVVPSVSSRREGLGPGRVSWGRRRAKS
jgi:hypothetical protein